MTLSKKVFIIQRDSKGRFVKGGLPYNTGNNVKQKKMNCIYCNKEFTFYPSNGPKRQFCSLSCKTSVHNKIHKHFGEKHWNWQGGKSFEVYPEEFNNYLKDFIREKYNYFCQKCKKQQKKPKLDIHHIDGNKNNCERINLIPLCRSCHIKIENNRRKYGN